MRKIQALIGLFLLGASLQVFALPSINGELGMGGNFVPVDVTGAPTGTASATGIDFDPNMFIVNTATGHFTGVGTIGDIKDFQFDPFTSPITEFWTIGGFSFELTSVTKGFTNDPAKFLILNGSGIISKAGFADTIGSWNFTGDTTGGGTFSWSAGSATTVPEPGAIALLGIGLIGFAGRKAIFTRKK